MLKFTVYRKPTHTDRDLNLNSCHLMEHKITVVHTISKRARELPSTNKAKIREVEHLQRVLRVNVYLDSSLPKRRMVLAGLHNRLTPKEIHREWH